MADPVYILTPMEYERLKKSDEVVTGLFRNRGPYGSNDAQKAIAEAFLREFDPERAQELGHIAYCFDHALYEAIQQAQKRTSDI